MRRAALFLTLLLAANIGCGLPQLLPTSTPPSGTPTAVSSPTSASTEIVATPTVGDETLATLRAARVPFADPEDLARRLAGLTQDLPDVIATPAAPLQPGAKQSFWVTDSDTDEQSQMPATLRHVTDHAYFWVEDGAAYDRGDLERLAATFEDRIYPTTRSFFGSEPIPGIDGDSHVYVLYSRGLGSNVAGYFSSVDTLHPLVRPDSNAHEMFVLNADTVDLTGEFTYGVLAHELQHMILWNVDIDEASWLNEGLSELAVYLNDLGTAGFQTAYTDDPVVSLNDWPNEDDRGASYGAASLFTLYFYHRFGPELTKALVAHPANGLEGIDLVFSEAGVVDPFTSQPVTAESTVLDWVIANFLADSEVLDGRFDYPGFADFSPAEETESLVECAPGPVERQVNQFAPHYIRMDCPGQRILEFDGAEETRLLDVEPFSGEYSFWSNKGDHADMRLTHSFDFAQAAEPITLSYWTWYDLETDWDYVYLLASEGGETWEFIETENGTDRNPTGNNYGWGYTGVSPRSEWIEETVDLSAYAGKQVLVRFEYVADASVNGEGMLLDDISIPAIEYSTDFQQDDGGWTAEGWVRVKNVLPQTFRLAWITFGNPTTVEYIPVGANNIAEIPMEVPEDGEARVLVILPTTRFTRQPASYTLRFSN